ncbi:MAG: LysR family transcriptional regulator [Coriobacteriales bacterium]|jgi:DNA-binding transcriptional LysR family regulator|nr:LysR family transcriptional regulator [Coriobacteriales bacterium]
MNIEVCREFITLAQCLSFTGAANKLNMTQPALSKHILALEKELGTELFDRNRSGVRLSEGGRLFFESASLIVSNYDKTRESLSQLKKTKPVRIGGHLGDSDIASQVSMITMLARENYQLPITFNRAAPKDILEQLQINEVDLCICFLTRERIEEAGFSYRPFFSLPLIAIMNANHPLAKRKKLHCDNLRNETFLKYVSGKTDDAFEQIEKICESHGFVPKTRLVPSANDIEFFTTPLQGCVLVWKHTQREIGFLLETGHRAAIPICDSDATLDAYFIYKPESEEMLESFFRVVEDSDNLLDRRHSLKEKAQ